MFTIINKQIIAAGFKRIDVKAELIARKAKPGHFVMVMADEKSARVALSIVEADSQKGTISFVFEETSPSTQQLGNLQIGGSIYAILGPLGVTISLDEVRKGHVVACVGYGIGIAQVLPFCRELRKSESKVIGIAGVKTRKALLLESQMRLTCDKLCITTDDGTYEKKGYVTGSLREMLQQYKIKLVICFAPPIVMQAVCAVTKEYRIKTFVGLNPLMVDGTGLCGSCRVKVSRKDALACVDGPVFNGHEVDFEDLEIRTKHCQTEESWYDQTFQASPLSGESITLKRWLGGLLKNRP